MFCIVYYIYYNPGMNTFRMSSGTGIRRDGYQEGRVSGGTGIRGRVSGGRVSGVGYKGVEYQGSGIRGSGTRDRVSGGRI